jgi:hypothetical protein
VKTSDITELNDTISKFIVQMASYEEKFLKEAPDVWEPILVSLSTLSDVSRFLDSVKMDSAKMDVDLYNKILLANNRGPLRGEKLRRVVDKDREVDFSRYIRKEEKVCQEQQSQ